MPVTADRLGEQASQAGRAGWAGHDLGAVFRQHHAELVRLAFLVVRDQPTAEDVVQDVFARLHAKPVTPRSGQELAYIRAAVINACRSVLRRRAISRRVAAIYDGHRDGGHGPSAEAEAIRAEDREEVLIALAALPERRRTVLILRYYLGLSEAEIASTLGISPGTVKSAAARGIAAMAKVLGEPS